MSPSPEPPASPPATAMTARCGPHATPARTGLNP